MHGGEPERLAVEHRRDPDARELPGGDVAEACVVTLRLTLGRLELLPEVAAARFLAMQRVVAHQLGELEEVRDAARVLECLVEILARAADVGVAPELLAQRADPVPCLLQPRRGARHAALVPHYAAQLAVEGVDAL